MFEAATKAGAKYILIVGENEIKADAFSLKNLATGEQKSSILLGVTSPPPPLALGATHARFAVADDAKITVVTLNLAAL